MYIKGKVRALDIFEQGKGSRFLHEKKKKTKNIKSAFVANSSEIVMILVEGNHWHITQISNLKCL